MIACLARLPSCFYLVLLLLVPPLYLSETSTQGCIIANDVSLCCFTNGTGACLPQVIIAGAQKSGSTVLAGYLASHPNVQFSVQKEVHFFDRTAEYRKGVPAYLKRFRPIAEPALNASVPVFAEATPFYLASEKACRRIATMIPSARLIVVLREPLARAHSEYYMKRRRVDEQNKFLQLMHRSAADVLKCVSLAVLMPSERITHLSRLQQLVETSCHDLLHTDITTAPHWKHFLASLMEHYRSNGFDWRAAIDICFSPAPVKSFAAAPFELNHLQQHSMFTHSLPLYADTLLAPYIGNTSLLLAALASSAKPQIRPLYFNISSADVIFHAVACMRSHASEHIGDEAQVFRDELHHLQRCFANLSAIALRSDPSAVLSALSDCIVVRSGIAQQFLYRSLYAPQLARCLQHIPRDRMLILSTDELEKNATDVMNKVFAFANLEEMRILDDASKVVDEQFPDFGRRTGWRLRSSYPLLDINVTAELQDFFKPFNELLDRVVGYNISEHWMFCDSD